MQDQPFRSHGNLCLGIDRQGNLKGICEPGFEVADELKSSTKLAMHRSP